MPRIGKTVRLPRGLVWVAGSGVEATARQSGPWMAVAVGLGRFFGFNATALRAYAVLLLLRSGHGVMPVNFTLLLPMPYAPLATGGQPLSCSSGKCRSSMACQRTKFQSVANFRVRQ